MSEYFYEYKYEIAQCENAQGGLTMEELRELASEMSINISHEPDGRLKTRSELCIEIKRILGNKDCDRIRVPKCIGRVCDHKTGVWGCHGVLNDRREGKYKIRALPSIPPMSEDEEQRLEEHMKERRAHIQTLREQWLAANNSPLKKKQCPEFKVPKCIGLWCDYKKGKWECSSPWNQESI